ncbi:MAG: 16S rRNA (cytidine(1402)-2'-O)-methyltransferase [Candidatus Limnocylindrales bacterium]|jgi:16S rRNA (cytidine1402-2'-O)-methyltransferase
MSRAASAGRRERPAPGGAAGARLDGEGGGTGDGGREGQRGRLFVVATPIGNLGDVTFRAVEVLKTVPLVAAEDTRLTRRLFARYEIATSLVSYHAQSSRGREAELLDHLRSGRDLALVTDAGTPLVSDPGAELASAWAAQGGIVVPIPGASAVLAALVASGLSVARWSFEGFLPRRGGDRRARLSRIAADDRACVIYEAPSRVPATLADLATAAGGERRAAVCRELTKLFEEVVRGSLSELASQAAAGAITLRGEFVLVVEAATGTGETRKRPAGEGSASMAEARAEVDRLVAGGARRSEAARKVAAATGLARQELYRPD